MRLGILGTGNMAEALIAGLLKREILKAHEISGFDVDARRLDAMRARYGITAAAGAPEAVRGADAVLLAVKPQQMAELLLGLKSGLKPGPLLISIAAGLDTRFFEKNLGKGHKIVRAMPNTPALVGLGATAFYGNKRCGPADLELASRLFGAVGIAYPVRSEALLDSVTGLSGSGPAFVYAFAKAMLEGGVKNGLKPELARELTLQTLAGAAQMLKQSADSIPELIQKVASKGGTTEAGLKVLQGRKFDSIVKACITAAAKRAKQLRGA